MTSTKTRVSTVDLANALPNQILVALAFESEESASINLETARAILSLYPQVFERMVADILSDEESLERFRLSMTQRLCRVGRAPNDPIRLPRVRTREGGITWRYDPTRQSPFKVHHREVLSSQVAFAAT